MHLRQAVVATACAAAALVLAPAALAKAPAATYPDATGDSSSAPDITKVVVTDKGNGAIDFTVDLANGSVQAIFGAEFDFWLDTDRNAATGDQGADYALVAAMPDVALLKWNGSSWDQLHPDVLLALLSPSGGELTLEVKLADVGSPASFGLEVYSWNGDDHDVVPGLVFPAKPVIKSFSIPSAVLLGPKAGKTFGFADDQISYELAEGSPETDITFTCTLTVGGKTLKSIGNACRWKIPKGTKGKRAVLTLTFYSGDTALVTKSFALKVR